MGVFESGEVREMMKTRIIVELVAKGMEYNINRKTEDFTKLLGMMDLAEALTEDYVAYGKGLDGRIRYIQVGDEVFEL